VGSAGRADLALPGKLQPEAGLDAGGDIHAHLAPRAHAALALARRAGVGDDRPVAAAGAARARGHDIAEKAAHRALDLPGALADVAGHRLGAGSAAGALAG